MTELETPFDHVFRAFRIDDLLGTEPTSDAPLNWFEACASADAIGGYVTENRSGKERVAFVHDYVNKASVIEKCRPFLNEPSFKEAFARAKAIVAQKIYQESQGY